jgi:hypothetical protein
MSQTTLASLYKLSTYANKALRGFTSKRSQDGDGDDIDQRARKQVRTEKGGKRGGAVSGTQQKSVFEQSNFLAAFKRLGYKLQNLHEEDEAFPDWELLNEVRFGSFFHCSAC